VYHIATRTSGTAIQGKLPLTAAEALAYVTRASQTSLEIRDAQGRKVSLRKLRKEASNPLRIPAPH
jgi:hypothetical protein